MNCRLRISDLGWRTRKAAQWMGWLAAIVLVLSVPNGAAARPSPTVSSGRGTSAPDKNSKTYTIGVTDELEVNVWKQPDVSRVVVVRPDGKISLPLVNDIQAAGLSPMALANNIATALKKFISDPEVTVTVTEPNSQKIYVIGQVMKSGPVSFFPHMTILDALASAGGVSQFAHEKKIFVIRKEPGGSKERIRFNYQAAMKGHLAQNIELKPGDTVMVP